MSFFDSIDLLPDDPIFGLPALFLQNPHPHKVNLGIGVYQDSEGHTTVLNCVRKAEALIEKEQLNKDYQPIDGTSQFKKSTLGLVFGTACKGIEAEEIYAAQTLGGTGALRLGSELLSQEISRTIYIPEPSWPNHQPIFQRAGMNVHSYPYYDIKTHQLEFSKMLHAIGSMHHKSIILLQACCQNPTGVDLSLEQWKELSKVLKKRQIVPFFDMAYQGFGTGFNEDAAPIRHFYEEGHELAVAYSFSKNMGLYGERAGMLGIVTHKKEATRNIGSQIRQIIRGMYSTPPLQGGRIVSTILNSPELTEEWQKELTNMRDRVNEMRRLFVAGLLSKSKNIDFSYLKSQHGLFSFCGLSPDQVLILRKQDGIFMPMSGRINVAGLNTNNVKYVIESMLKILHS